MKTADAADDPEARLQRLSGYLTLDPNNPVLLEHAGEAAFALGDFALVHTLLGRRRALGPASSRAQNLEGLLALHDQRYVDAVSIFAPLWEQTPDDPSLSFNLAWARAKLGDHQGTFAALERPSATASAAAAVVKVRALHHLGRLDDALKEGDAFARRFAGDGALLGALATAALDAGETQRALAYARAAGENAEGLIVLGMLSLDGETIDAQPHLFDRAIAAAPGNPRAMLGKGLELLIARQPGTAARYIERAAALFEDHLGSWVAAGWAHFLAGELQASRAAFERALALDDRFAEAQGGVAVLDIAEGRREEGERRMQVAIRLDRQCLSGALAKIMLLDRDGRTDMAVRIREAALNRPLDESGRTLAQALVRFGFSTP